MTCFRTFSPELVDLYINHPSIRPTIDRTAIGRLSSEDIVGWPGNVVIVGEPGVFIFAGLGSGRYIAHVGILDDHRGRAAWQLGKAAFGMLFGQYDARSCVAEAPLALPHVAAFARRLGFTGLGVDLDAGIEHLIKESV